MTTIYVGEHYEKNISTGAITKYYYFCGKRIAMRVGTTLTYLHSDHLGSASLATNDNGGLVLNSEQRYTPFGSSRLSASGLTTNRRFNGMKEEAVAGGIYDFCEAPPNEVSGATQDLEFILSEAKELRDRAVLERGYDCPKGGFALPLPSDPQSLNRFAFVRNNPLNRVDPSGHADCDDRQNGCQNTSTLVKTKPQPITNAAQSCVYLMGSCSIRYDRNTTSGSIISLADKLAWRLIPSTVVISGGPSASIFVQNVGITGTYQGGVALNWRSGQNRNVEIAQASGQFGAGYSGSATIDLQAQAYYGVYDVKTLESPTWTASSGGEVGIGIGAQASVSASQIEKEDPVSGFAPIGMGINAGVGPAVGASASLNISPPQVNITNVGVPPDPTLLHEWFPAVFKREWGF